MLKNVITHHVVVKCDNFRIKNVTSLTYFATLQKPDCYAKSLLIFYLRLREYLYID